MLLAEFYKGAPDLVKFQEAWSPEHTYLDKLKVRRWTPTYPGSMVSTGHIPESEEVFPSLRRSQDLCGWVRAPARQAGAQVPPAAVNELMRACMH